MAKKITVTTRKGVLEIAGEAAMKVPPRAAARGLGCLLLLLLGLALLKQARVAPVAAWSWWAITAPLWAPWVLAAAAALIRKTVRY